MDVIKTNNKTILISPLEFRHFVLDIPKVNEKYQKQAVQFALKSYYPGTDENTAIDYAYYNSKVIGIAVSTNRLETLENEYAKIISPTLVIMNSFKEGIFICCSKDWLELQVISEGEIISLHTFSTTSIKSVIRKLKEIKNCSNLQNLKITLINNDGDISSFEKILQTDDYEYTICPFEQLLNKASDSNTYIFNKKEIKSKGIFFYLFVFLLMAVLLTVLICTQTKKHKLENQLQEVKVEYNELKAEIKENQSVKTETNEAEIIMSHSLHEIISEIVNTSDSLIVNSFSYSNNTIRFEAENAKAIEVLDNLKKSDFIYDITLIQSLPKGDGNEKFIITGKIR